MRIQVSVSEHIASAAKERTWELLIYWLSFSGTRVIDGKHLSSLEERDAKLLTQIEHKR